MSAFDLRNAILSSCAFDPNTGRILLGLLERLEQLEADVTVRPVPKSEPRSIPVMVRWTAYEECARELKELSSLVMRLRAISGCPQGMELEKYLATVFGVLRTVTEVS